MRTYSLLVSMLLLLATPPSQGQTSQSAQSYFSRAADSYKKGNLDAAIADFGVALTFDPKWPLAYTLRGSARYEKGDLEGAISDYDKAIELDPRWARAYNDRGIARQSFGHLKEASI